MLLDRSIAFDHHLAGKVDNLIHWEKPDYLSGYLQGASEDLQHNFKK